MTVALRARRLALGLVPALFVVQVTVVSAGQSGTKPSVVPAKPSIAPPRMSQEDVTKPAAGHGHEATPAPAKAAEHSKPAGSAKAAQGAKTAEPSKTTESTKTASNAKPAPSTKTTPGTKAVEPAQPGEPAKVAEAAPAAAEHAKEAETTRVTRQVVTPGRDRRKSAERAVAVLGAALSARRGRATRQEAAAPPPAEPPAPVRRPAPRRRATPPTPPPPPPRYEVPWPSRIVELHWPTPSEHRAVAWPSDRPEPIELRWDLKALQSDLSEPTAAVTR